MATFLCSLSVCLYLFTFELLSLCVLNCSHKNKINHWVQGGKLRHRWSLNSVADSASWPPISILPFFFDKCLSFAKCMVTQPVTSLPCALCRQAWPCDQILVKGMWAETKHVIFRSYPRRGRHTLHGSFAPLSTCPPTGTPSWPCEPEQTLCPLGLRCSAWEKSTYLVLGILFVLAA